MSKFRRVFPVLVAVSIVFPSLVGCTASDSVPPDEVARQFVAAVVAGDPVEAARLSNQGFSESDITELREAWIGVSQTGSLDSVSFASVGIDEGTVSYYITELDVADIDEEPFDSSENSRAVYLIQEGARWTVAFAE
ncbi:MAG: hypothetical protein Q7U89_06000 [Coriobacteriia bacterium]|nr:hypothetical protein [Coriobacteriia bacterium]